MTRAATDSQQLGPKLRKMAIWNRPWLAYTLALGLMPLAACGSDSSEAEAPPPASGGSTTGGAGGGEPGVGGASTGAAGAGGVPTGGAVAVETAAIAPYIDACVSTPTEYGAYGALTAYDRYEIKNPAWVGNGERPVEVLVPTGGAETHPVLFYAHPYGGTDWTRAREVLEFLVSHDYVVVYTPYPTLGATICQRYDVLWGGMLAAVTALGDQAKMDTARVGIIGHSFGGGASPWLARQAQLQGWGAEGRFVYSNAPWYSFRVTEADFAELADTRFLLMTFADDDTNDHRVGIEHEYSRWQGPREYMMLPSAKHGLCELTADHVVPNNATLNGLDTWGVWRHAQAMAACTLRGVIAACALVDGQTALETSMGTWLTAPVGDVPPATATDAPAPVRPQSAYQFPLDDAGSYPCDSENAGSSGGG